MCPDMIRGERNDPCVDFYTCFLLCVCSGWHWDVATSTVRWRIPSSDRAVTPQTTHYAFVVNNNPAGNSSTVQIDVSGDTNLQIQPSGAGAVAESFLANNNSALFTANSLADSVTEYTTFQTFAPVTTINLPIGSRPIAVSTARPGSMYALNSSRQCQLPEFRFDQRHQHQRVGGEWAPTCVGPSPVSFAQLPGGTKIYVVNGDNTVSVFDPDAGLVTSIINQSMGLGLNPVFVIASLDSNYVFVVNKGDGINPGSLSIITTTTDQVAQTIPLGSRPNLRLYRSPFGFACTSSTRAATR